MAFNPLEFCQRKFVAFKKLLIPHSAQGILNLDFAELLVGLRLNFLQEFTLGWQHLLEGLLEVRLGG
jgi:hypothetical protein